MGHSRTRRNSPDLIHQTKTGDFTPTAADSGTIFICDNGTNNITVTLNTMRAGVWFMFRNSGEGFVILGTTSVRLAPNEMMTLVSSGTGWQRISQYLHVPESSPWRWPATAHADDDEFWSEINNGWTEVDHGSGGATNADYNDIASHVIFEWPGGGDGSTDLWLHKDITSPASDMSYEAGIRIAAHQAGEWLGLGVFSSDLQDGMVMTIANDSGSHVAKLWSVDAGGWSGRDSVDIAAAGRTGDFIIGLARGSSDFWQGRWSVGESVANMHFLGIHEKSFTVAKLVLISASYNCSAPHINGVDYVRRTF